MWGEYIVFQSNLSVEIDKQCQNYLSLFCISVFSEEEPDINSEMEISVSDLNNSDRYHLNLCLRISAAKTRKEFDKIYLLKIKSKKRATWNHGVRPFKPSIECILIV